MIGHYERGLSIELEREAEVPSDSEDYVYLEWFTCCLMVSHQWFLKGNLSTQEQMHHCK